MGLLSFSDVGKPAKDLFSKHFKFNILSFDFKSKTDNDVDVHMMCERKQRGNVDAAADVKFKPVHDISVKTKIDSDWLITNDVEIKDKLPSTKHNIITSLDYKTGEKKLQLKNAFTHDNANAEFEVNFASKYPTSVASIVVGDKGYVAGAQVSVDTNSGFQLVKHVYSVGYMAKGFQLHGFLTNHKNAELRLFQSYRDIDLGFMLGMKGGLSNTDFGIAAMYKPSRDTFVKVRLNETGAAGLAYGFKPSPESQVVVSMESSIDDRSEDARFGLSFEVSN